LKVHREIKEAKGGPAPNLNSGEGSFQNPRKQSAIHNPDICNAAAESTSGKNRDREGIDNYKAAHKYKALSLITCLAVMTIPTMVEFFVFQRPPRMIIHPNFTFFFSLKGLLLHSMLIGLFLIHFCVMPEIFNENILASIVMGLGVIIGFELSLFYDLYSSGIPLYDVTFFCLINSISSILAYIIYSSILNRRFSIVYILLLFPGILILSYTIFQLKITFISLLEVMDLANYYSIIMCSFFLSIIYQILIVLSLTAYFNGLVKGHSPWHWLNW
jgi:hypothetical protein